MGVDFLERKWVICAASAAMLLAAVAWRAMDMPELSDSVPAFAAETAGESQTGEPAAQSVFPWALEDNGLVVEALASYEGPYWEDGSDEPVSGVAALMLYNPSGRVVEYAAVAVEQGMDTLYFFVSWLPPESRCLVLEKNRAAYSCQAVTGCRALLTCWGGGETDAPQLEIGWEDLRMAVTNCSAATVPDVTVHYKMYAPSDGCYLGGIAYSVHLTALLPGQKRLVTAYHFAPETGKVVAIT